MRWTRFNISAALIGIALLIAILSWSLISARTVWLPSRPVKSAYGRVVRLDAWRFQATPASYDLPYRPWRKRLDKVLPKWVQQTLGSAQPLINCVATPQFRGEPFLSAAFSISNPPKGAELNGLRLVVADDLGQEFDPAVHDSNVRGEKGIQYWAGEVPAFPRRGQYLRLRLAQEADNLPEIIIPNPAHGFYPNWNATPLPVTAGDADLTFSLVKFRSYQPGTNTYTKFGVYPRTQCVFRVRESGRDSTSWRPVSFEISDATSNHWKPWLDSL